MNQISVNRKFGLKPLINDEDFNLPSVTKVRQTNTGNKCATKSHVITESVISINLPVPIGE